ncbi:LLM class flavin-dependent oxidoreductase [Streptomyces sp. M19]
MGDGLDHDARYRRLTEYGDLVRRLLTATRPVTHTGEFYTLRTARLIPGPAPDLAPRLFVSGASQECLRIQRTLTVTRLTYPQETSAYRGEAPLAGAGIRIGVIARESSEAAWRVARRRFPPDRGERRCTTGRRAGWSPAGTSTCPPTPGGPPSRAACTGSTPSAPTRPSARTWSAATTRSPTCWPGTSPSGSA